MSLAANWYAPELITLIKTVAKTGGIINTVCQGVIDKKDQVKSRKAVALIERTIAIAAIINRLGTATIKTNFGVKLVQTLVDAYNWAQVYLHKYKLSKLIHGHTYRRRFLDYQNMITRDMQDLSRGLQLESELYDLPDNY